jgi:hypothetical protein
MRRASSNVSTSAMSARLACLSGVDVDKGLTGCVQHPVAARLARVPETGRGDVMGAFLVTSRSSATQTVLRRPRPEKIGRTSELMN